MADPATALPEETRDVPLRSPTPALRLLRRHDFRNLFLAISASELGDSLHYIALMWVALQTGGPLGVVAVRLADSVPALLFGLHGGLVADRWDRRSVMVAADLVRGATLVPIALAGLSGHLPLWALVAASFLLEAATSYFAPAYGALVPSLVDRGNAQQANALVQASAQALSIGGWALAAALLAVVPVSAFFAINAASFFVSALLISRVRRQTAARQAKAEASIREGFAALRPRPTLAIGVLVLGVAVTISSGTWIGGVPTFVRDHLHGGAGAFSVVMVGYAVGSIASGAVLARRPVRRKAFASLVAWTLYLPAYGLIALGGALWAAVAGAFVAACGQSSARVLLVSAAQEDVPDALLGRVLGLISLVHRGAHATGLLLVAPLFAVLAPQSVFAGAAVALALVGMAGAAAALAVSSRRAT
jgi:DHA3 family macrolide efflux protein-like MFS transporter